MAIAREARRPLPIARAAGTSDALYDKLSPGPGKSASEVAAHQRARIQGAMIKLVAEGGYSAVTVRDLARVAGVSTRAFYKLFDGKESCFQQTYEMIVRRVAKRVITSQAGERDWLKRLQLAFDAFFSELEDEPQAARLALVEAYTAGPAMRRSIRRAERTFEAMIDESFRRAPGGIASPPLVIEGIVAGMTSVVRDRDLDGPKDHLRKLVEPLLLWSLSHRSNYATPLDLVEPTTSSWRDSPDQILSTSADASKAQIPTSDRALLLSAVMKLASSEGCEELTSQGICAAAGVSRRRFNELFSNADQCLLNAFEQRVAVLLAQAKVTQIVDRLSVANEIQSFARFCIQVASDPILSSPCFGQALSAGPIGADHGGQRLLGAALGVPVRDVGAVEADRDQLSREASVAAVWALVRRYVESGRARDLPQIASTLSFIVAAPMIGSSAAIEEINRALAGLSQLENICAKNLTVPDRGVMLSKREVSTGLASSSTTHRN